VSGHAGEGAGVVQMLSKMVETLEQQLSKEKEELEHERKRSLCKSCLEVRTPSYSNLFVQGNTRYGCSALHAPLVLLQMRFTYEYLFSL
jgi:hypothetical protein